MKSHSSPSQKVGSPAEILKYVLFSLQELQDKNEVDDRSDMDTDSRKGDKEGSQHSAGHYGAIPNGTAKTDDGNLATLGGSLQNYI